MKAMLLAAGLGKRLRPRTDHLPKPLLEVAGETLIHRHLKMIAGFGIREVVINLHHLGDLIRNQLRDGQDYGLQIQYSVEETLLETGGGIKQALGLLGDLPFLVVSADTYIEDVDSSIIADLPTNSLGRLLMIDNPPHHPDGDFAIHEDGRLFTESPRLTYSGIGFFDPGLVAGVQGSRFMLRQEFDRRIDQGRLHGDYHSGFWCDVGTEQRYQSLIARCGQTTRAASLEQD